MFLDTPALPCAPLGRRARVLGDAEGRDAQPGPELQGARHGDGGRRGPRRRGRRAWCARAPGISGRRWPTAARVEVWRSPSSRRGPPTRSSCARSPPSAPTSGSKARTSRTPGCWRARSRRRTAPIWSRTAWTSRPARAPPRSASSSSATIRTLDVVLVALGGGAMASGVGYAVRSLADARGGHRNPARRRARDGAVVASANGGRDGPHRDDRRRRRRALSDPRGAGRPARRARRRDARSRGLDQGRHARCSTSTRDSSSSRPQRSASPPSSRSLSGSPGGACHHDPVRQQRRPGRLRAVGAGDRSRPGATIGVSPARRRGARPACPTGSPALLGAGADRSR